MLINSNTKIASILKHNPESLEAIISVSPRFLKLRFPIIRKLMAGRTSIEMAAKVAGCSIMDLFEKLKPLGFEIDTSTIIPDNKKKLLPRFIGSLKTENISILDVRPIIAADKDPLQLIIERINTIKPGEALKIINSFEPIPLILLLKKKGFTSYTDIINDHLVHTFFYKETASETDNLILPSGDCTGWQEILHRFKNHLKTIDVRLLQMPLPMITILNELENLPAETALLVHHKRIPVFLLPELADKKFEHRIKEIRDGEVDILIFKN